MAHGSIRNHLPLIRILAILLSLLLFIAWGLYQFAASNEPNRVQPAAWQWAVSDATASALPPAEDWRPLTNVFTPYDEGQAYWLRVPLRDAELREPQLWIMNVATLAVYDKGGSLYTYDPAENGHRINMLYHWNLVPLPVPLPSEVFLYVDNHRGYNPEPDIQLIDKGEFITYLIQKDMYCFMIGGLFLFCFFFSLGLYAIRRDRLHLLYLALLSLCGSYASVVRNNLMQWLWDQPWLSYLEFGVFPLGVFIFVSILNVVFGDEHTRTLRKLRWVILAFAIATITGAVILPIQWFELLISYPLLALFLVSAGIVLGSLWSIYRVRKDIESIWMLAGFFVVTAVALIHVLRVYLPAFFNVVKGKIPLLGQLPFDILSIGLFLFLICNIRVIIYRFGLMNTQLKAFNHSLEQKVELRTAELREREAELQEANARLADSMKETAEAYASTMVMEERHRLTGTIHDTIGHSLTATIVQLEAARRLLTRDPELAENKIDASTELIRRGLEQLRQSASLMDGDSTAYNLQDALLNLIKETADATGAVIRYQIDPLPADLTTLQKRVLFQALQEGLTNGLRHSGSRHFEFSLRAEQGTLAFKLVSDGLTYTPSAYGFGLRAMSERVSNLGGTMAIAPGQPGCILTLTLPYHTVNDRHFGS